MDTNGRQLGKIKWFNSEKGFGFATREGAPDVFVHVNNLPEGVDDLKPGQKISFNEETTRKGVRATSVRLESA